MARCLLVPLHADSSARNRLGPVLNAYIWITRRTLAQECHNTHAIDAVAAVRVSAPPNQCAASVTTGRAPTHSARTDRNTHHKSKAMTTNVADDDAARLAALIGDSDSVHRCFDTYIWHTP